MIMVCNALDIYEIQGAEKIIIVHLSDNLHQLETSQNVLHNMILY